MLSVARSGNLSPKWEFKKYKRNSFEKVKNLKFIEIL